jgi:hypothetical protein
MHTMDILHINDLTKFNRKLLDNSIILLVCVCVCVCGTSHISRETPARR